MSVPVIQDAVISRWLAANVAAIRPLHAAHLRAEIADGAIIDKVGMLPIAIKDGELYVRLAKPLAKKPELGDPGFQLPKGTRTFWDEARHCWQDIGRGHDPERWDGVILESLPHAALRESMEEVGTRPENITRVWDLGPIAVKSATKGSEKIVHMFAAKVADMDAFNAPDGAHALAANVGWFAVPSPAMAADHVSAQNPIRPDHAAFLAGLRPVLAPVIGMAA